MEKDLAQRIHRQASRLCVKGCLHLARASLWQEKSVWLFLLHCIKPYKKNTLIFQILTLSLALNGKP